MFSEPVPGGLYYLGQRILCWLGLHDRTEHVLLWTWQCRTCGRTTR